MPALPDVCVKNNITPAVIITSCYSSGPYGYQWTFANGLPAISTDSLPGYVSFSAPGVQPIQLIVTDSSCMQSDTINTSITVLPLPVTQVANDTIVCSGATISLGGAAVAGVTYLWSPAIGLNDPAIANPIATLNYGGPASDTTYTYYLTISQGANCSNLDAVKIKVKRKPVVTVDLTSAQICLGTNVVLTANGADTYSWTPAAGLNNSTSNSVIATPATTTTYTVTGSLANGCSADQARALSRLALTT